ncbi:hypothetical protein FJQ98_07815 [Lysinibacillus agricola]|uniref:ABM domain-containing protein n=1 Tax=Lysinibacillus agricola TaxID=2590012 RepID=A0ABX7AVR8_9BACI|nr:MULTISPECIES: hypothetical protein [Lysinibacillus]KOS62959.1 hypothetical protein AN161_11720 [Lysinibacillus sp. FJAT-14222]QQP13929.1 hypothetical protein FJQ98_07815 [Lysinibacillus agricola]
MKSENPKYVMEIVLFELKEGTDTQLFCQAAAQLTEVLQLQIPGFKERTLLHTQDESQWTDIIYWDNMEMTLGAMEQLKSVPVFQTFVSMIDSREIVQRHLIPTNLNI